MSLPSGLGAGGRGKEKAPCRYLHFEVDYDGTIPEAVRERNRVSGAKGNGHGEGGTHRLGIGMGPEGKDVELVWQEWSSYSEGSLLTFRRQLPPQWINCDLRRFDYSVLGKFHVIMADPPWDIHMSVSSLIFLPPSATNPSNSFGLYSYLMGL